MRPTTCFLRSTTQEQGSSEIDAEFAGLETSGTLCGRWLDIQWKKKTVTQGPLLKHRWPALFALGKGVQKLRNLEHPHTRCDRNSGSSPFPSKKKRPLVWLVNLISLLCATGRNTHLLLCHCCFEACDNLQLGGERYCKVEAAAEV